MPKFPFYKQADFKDCGPTCLKIISAYYHKNISIEKLRSLSENTREGSSLLGLSDAAEKLHFKSIGAKLSLDSLKEMNLPCILHWNKNHYVVLYKIVKDNYFVSDPAHDLLKYKEDEFLKHLSLIHI